MICLKLTETPLSVSTAGLAGLAGFCILAGATGLVAREVLTAGEG